MRIVDQVNMAVSSRFAGDLAGTVAVMRYRILGPLEVLDDEGRTIQPGQTERQLLAMLLLHPGEAVSTDRLADAMWGEDLPANPQNALQARVSRLRKLVGRETIVTRTPGYAIEIDPGSIDARRFEQLLTAGRAATDPKERWTLFDEALELWRGPALAGVAYEDFARAEAERLDMVRIDAVEARIDAALDLGKHAEVIAELEALIIEHPLREGLYTRLMLALYRAGRQAEALRMYGDARHRLGEELGIEPGPDLVALEEAILLQDPSLSPSLPSHAVFPAPLTSFVGRAVEMEAIAEGLERSRLVTLVGSGGVGKTRLAIEAVGSMDTDRGFVDLGGVTSPDMVVAEVVSAYRLDRRHGGFGAAPAPVDLEDAVVAHFRGRNFVLVVDNCEHVVDEAARFIESLLMRVPDLRVVGTSRERLGVPGEVVLQVLPLRLTGNREGALDSEAASLFIERARNIDPGFDAVAVADVVADICLRLDGIPLAIELAAARTRSLTVPAIAARLDDRFRLLTGGSRTAIARQRTLRAAIDWSFQLLEEDQQLVFRRIALFAGPFGLPAAEAIAGGHGIDADEAFDVLDRLVDQSMVVQVPGAEPRFRLLENLRAYGRDQLAESNEGDATTRRMIDYYAALVDDADPKLRTGEQLEWMERLAAEYDNITAALDMAWSVDPEVAVRGTGRLGWFWYLRGMFEEADRWLQRALAGSAEGRERAMAEVHFTTAMLSSQSPAAMPSLTEARALARASGHWFIEASALAAIGAFGMGADPAAGLAAIARAREIFEEHRDEWGVALTFFVTAVGGSHDVRNSARLAEEARRGFEKTGDSWGVGYAEYILGACHRVLGEYDSALESYASALDKAMRIGMLNEVPNIPTELANVSTLRGDYEAAALYLAEAVHLAERHPWGAAIASAANAAGFLARRTGRPHDAIARHTAALSIYRESESPPGIAYTLGCLGFAEEFTGDLDLAESHHLEALKLAQGFADVPAIQRDLAVAFALEGLAAVAAARDDGTRAATLLGAAHRLRSDHGVPLPPGEDLDVARARDAAIGMTGPAGYEAAFRIGHDMSREDLDGYIAVQS